MFEMIFRKQVSELSSESIAETLWKEIEKRYTKSSRHYHTLSHLDAVLNELHPLKKQITDWTVVMFAIAYHDIIYNVLKQDNEEKSAALAHKRLTDLLLPESKIIRCSELILATKTHASSPDTDCNYFTDADLCILGKNQDTYHNYCKQIRKEYKYYPDIIYKPGRQKVLKHFLGMTRIYKTQYFQERYEEKARKNMQEELALLE